MADITWSQGWGFEYYTADGNIDDALATRDSSGNITITDYAKQNLSTTELVGLMQDLGLAGPPAPPPKPPDPPKLSDTGLEIQWALDQVAAGGDKQSIVDAINKRAYSDLVAGKTDAATALADIAANYANSDQYGASDTQGIARLRMYQLDINAGRYDRNPAAGTPPPTTATPAPTGGLYQGWGFRYESPTGDVNDATAIWYQGWGFEYQSPTGNVNDATSIRLPDGTIQKVSGAFDTSSTLAQQAGAANAVSGDATVASAAAPMAATVPHAVAPAVRLSAEGETLVNRHWPQLTALGTYLQGLATGTWPVHVDSVRPAVQQVVDEQNQELLRQMRARGYG